MIKTESEIKPTSLRQSKNWGKYLESLGWEIKKTDFGVDIAFLKTYLGYVSKIQRPKPMSRVELEKIESLCREKKAMFIKIEPGMGQNEQLLKELGYEDSNFPLSPPKTLIIELTKTEKELWKDLSRSGKYSVNRARRENNAVTFYKFPKNGDQIAKFYQTVKSTGKRGKFYVQPISDLKTKIKIFKDRAYLIEVRDEKGILLSTKFFFGEGNTVTFLQGGTTKEGRRSKGGYLMMWESILYFKNLGYKYIDLEGVDDDRFPVFTKNWGGFSHFKEKFGGAHVTFPRPCIKYLSPVLKFFKKFMALPF